MSIQMSGIINPFASLQSLSMGCGTDMIHHLDFQKVEDYRRDLSKHRMTNMLLEAKTGDWRDCRSRFLKSVAIFSYALQNNHVFETLYN